MTGSSSKDKAVTETATAIMTTETVTIVKNYTPPSRTIKTYDGRNYAIWAIHMKDILRERKLLKYLEERDDITNYQEEGDLNAMAEIRFTLSDEQVQHTLKCKTTHEIWEKLKSNHSYSSESNLIFLKKQLLDMQMKSNESIQAFVLRINKLVEQITSLSEEKVSDLDKSLILTRGVPEKFRMNIIAMQELNRLSDFEHVVSSLTNEEMRLNEKKKGGDTQDSENAFYSYARGQTRGQGNRGNRSGMTNRFEGNCRFCGIVGHKEFECRKKQQENNHSNYESNRSNYGSNRSDNRANRGYHRGNYNNHSNQGNYNKHSNQGNYNNHSNQANISKQIDEHSAFTALFTSEDLKNQWILDTGASQHMMSNCDLFSTYKKLEKPIKIRGIGNTIVYAQGRGNIEINMHVFGKTSRGTFMDVLHVPEAERNLISIRKVMKQKLTIQIEENEATIYKNGKPVLMATMKGDIFIIDCIPFEKDQANVVTTTANSDMQLWHQ
jgi:hypothetical protein